MKARRSTLSEAQMPRWVIPAKREGETGAAEIGLCTAILTWGDHYWQAKVACSQTLPITTRLAQML